MKNFKTERERLGKKNFIEVNNDTKKLFPILMEIYKKEFKKKTGIEPYLTQREIVDLLVRDKLRKIKGDGK